MALLAMLATLLLAPVIGWASAFNWPAGQGIAILGGTFEDGDRSFDTQGRAERTAPYDKSAGSLYIEYGLTDWLQAIVRPEFVSARLGGPDGGRYTGLGTSEVGAQLRALAFGPAVLAVQGSFELPASSSRTNPALINSTSRDAEGRALLGVVFPINGWPSFLNVELAYRVRGAHAPDEARADVTLGIRPLDHWLILVQDFTVLPTERGTPFFPRSTYSKAELSVVYDIDSHWSVQLGLFQTVFARNALDEHGVQAAVWYRF